MRDRLEFLIRRVTHKVEWVLNTFMYLIYYVFNRKKLDSLDILSPKNLFNDNNAVLNYTCKRNKKQFVEKLKTEHNKSNTYNRLVQSTHVYIMTRKNLDKFIKKYHMSNHTRYGDVPSRFDNYISGTSIPLFACGESHAITGRVELLFGLCIVHINMHYDTSNSKISFDMVKKYKKFIPSVKYRRPFHSITNWHFESIYNSEYKKFCYKYSEKSIKKLKINGIRLYNVLIVNRDNRKNHLYQNDVELELKIGDRGYVSGIYSEGIIETTTDDSFVFEDFRELSIYKNNIIKNYELELTKLLDDTKWNRKKQNNYSMLVKMKEVLRTKFNVTELDYYDSLINNIVILENKRINLKMLRYTKATVAICFLTVVIAVLSLFNNDDLIKLLKELLK